MEIPVFEKLIAGGKITLEDDTLVNFNGNAITMHAATFANTHIVDSGFETSTFYQCQIRQNTFKGCNLKKAALLDCELTDVTFQGCSLSHINLERCTLRNVCFINCELDWANFSEGMIQNITFNICRLQGAIFTAIRLHDGNEIRVINSFLEI